jgi:hypothetical protein
MGLRCHYVARLWKEEALEKERREAAHEAIVEGIERGAAAVVWDVHDAEWGLVVGYDRERSRYDTLTCKGETAALAFEKLGRNGIDILSVAIPGGPNGRTREEVVCRSLQAAVAHTEGKEWTDRPAYQDGLPAATPATTCAPSRTAKSVWPRRPASTSRGPEPSDTPPRGAGAQPPMQAPVWGPMRRV